MGSLVLGDGQDGRKGEDRKLTVFKLNIRTLKSMRTNRILLNVCKMYGGCQEPFLPPHDMHT